ncbi:MAG TPA: phosphodiester glycosidase family protein [Thermoanaerobaculia bacterium]|nr:phosphodiester glycosidase family protein [Thermoanaerobaculia bacterium]
MTLALAAILALQGWKTLQPGVEFTTAGTLYIVRVDPNQAALDVALASEEGAARTALEWSRHAHMSIVINLGMFQSDQRSNVGYLRHGSHLNNPRFNNYRSVLAANPGILWLDFDPAKRTVDLTRYNVVVQNLRLIAANRNNVWSPSNRRWSEAALAEDSRGRVLFLFSRVPYSMREFNERILKLPLDITRAMHLEGGPEASLSIHAGGVDLDLCGSYETGFLENGSNEHQWPIPNVLGVIGARSP